MSEAAPESLVQLFRVFNRLALQGFGGVLPVARHVLVDEERWLDPEEFVEMLAICQVMPGPNVINLSMMMGHRFFGLRGALTAVAGMMLVPGLIVIALALVYGQLATHPVAVNAVRGMGAVSAGLITSTGLKMASSLFRNPMGRTVALGLAAVTALCMLWLHVPLLIVVLLIGGTGWVFAWRGTPA